MFKLHRVMEERLLYYIVALSVAGIGYVINVTIDEVYSEKLLLVGIAILLWFVSASLGMSAISKLIEITRKNFDMLGEFDMAELQQGKGPESIQMYIEKVMIPSLKTKVSWMKRCFVSGIIAFILWRMIDLLGLI